MHKEEYGDAGGRDENSNKSYGHKIGDVVVGDPGSKILCPSKEGASMQLWELRGSEEKDEG